MVEKKRKSSQAKTNEQVTEQTPLTVGQYLAKIRTEQGHTIEDVSNAIHIRMAQLRAIEESRIGDLPGMTYALGFVRSYAQFLKLDINDIVNRFKLEHAVASAQKPDPAPVQEIEDDKKPDAPVMMFAGAAVLFLLVWAFWPQTGTDPGTIEAQEIVAEIQEPPSDIDAPPPIAEPAPVVAEVTEQKQPEPEVIKMTAAGQPPRILPLPRPAPASPPVAEAAIVAEVAPPAETPVVAVAETVPPAAEIQPPAQVVDATVTVTPAAEIVPPAVEIPAPVAAVNPSEVITVTPIVASAIPASLPIARPKAVPQNQAAAAITSGTPAPDQTIVVARPRGKIVIKAIGTSWVEVLDAKDKTIFKKVMRPGDQYFVPDQKGLTLTTSNAAGIELIVGGKKAPKVGRGGEIISGIELNAERLLQKRIRTRD